MGPTPQWCETAIRSANGGFFTLSQASSLKRGCRETRTKDGSVYETVRVSVAGARAHVTVLPFTVVVNVVVIVACVPMAQSRGRSKAVTRPSSRCTTSRISRWNRHWVFSAVSLG